MENDIRFNSYQVTFISQILPLLFFPKTTVCEHVYSKTIIYSYTMHVNTRFLVNKLTRTLGTRNRD